MKNISYTKLFSAFIASGLFVVTLTNSSAVFSQAAESSGLSQVFKKVEQLDLLAAVGDSSAPTQAVTGLTKPQVQAKYNALAASGKSGRALLQSFLSTTEGKAQQELFLEVAKEQMPGQEALIGEVASASGFDAVLVLAQTGFDTAAGDTNQQQQAGAGNGAGAGAGAGGGAPQVVSPTNAS